MTRPALLRFCVVVIAAAIWWAPPVARAQGNEAALGAGIAEIIRALLLAVGGVVELVLVLVALGAKRRKPILLACIVIGGALTVGAARVALDCGSWLASDSLGPYQDQMVPFTQGMLFGSVLAGGLGLWGVALGLQRLRQNPADTSQIDTK